MKLCTTAQVVPLARDSHVAMHRQLAQRLRDAITRGEYPAQARIPTEPELANRFRVSRITVRQAVEALAREGLVVRRQGKGTFVAGPVVHHDLFELRGLFDALVAQGHQPRTRLLDYRLASPPPAVAARLGTGPRQLPHWRRLYVLRGKPFAVTDVYLAAGRRRLTRGQVDRNPTYSILEKLLGEQVARADVSIRFQSASEELAGILELPRRAPLMRFERMSFGADSRPLEHSVYFARAETYEFGLSVRGKLPIAPALKAAG